MVHRPLGTSGLSVTPIGFGAFKIGRNRGIKYPQSYALPAETEAARLLNGVLDLGINYIDTAPAYGLSEERIGRAIAHRRAEFVLSTKVGETFTEEGSTHDFENVAASVERSLRRLRTDVIDILFIHSDGRDLEIQRETGIIEKMREQRHQGRVRLLGFSGKTVEGAREALAWADVLMVTLHPGDLSHAEAAAEAQRRGVGVVVKKGLASGHAPPSEAIPTVLALPGVSSMVIGGLSLDHMRENVALAEGGA